MVIFLTLMPCLGLRGEEGTPACQFNYKEPAKCQLENELIGLCYQLQHKRAHPQWRVALKDKLRTVLARSYSQKLQDQIEIFLTKKANAANSLAQTATMITDSITQVTNGLSAPKAGCDSCGISTQDELHDSRYQAWDLQRVVSTWGSKLMNGDYAVARFEQNLKVSRPLTFIGVKHTHRLNTGRPADEKIKLTLAKNLFEKINTEFKRLKNPRSVIIEGPFTEDGPSPCNVAMGLFLQDEKQILSHDEPFITAWIALQKGVDFMGGEIGTKKLVDALSKSQPTSISENDYYSFEGLRCLAAFAGRPDANLTRDWTSCQERSEKKIEFQELKEWYSRQTGKDLSSHYTNHPQEFQAATYPDARAQSGPAYISQRITYIRDWHLRNLMKSEARSKNVLTVYGMGHLFANYPIMKDEIGACRDVIGPNSSQKCP